MCLPLRNTMLPSAPEVIVCRSKNAFNPRSGKHCGCSATNYSPFTKINTLKFCVLCNLNQLTD